MDAIQNAYLQNARNALDMALSGAHEITTNQKSAAFVQGALTVLRAGRADAVASHLSRHANPLVQKASAELFDGRWGEGAAAELASSYLASVSPGSLLDQSARYAAVVPVNLHVAMAASGFSANVIAEGGVKVVKNANIAPVEADPIKVAAIVVMSSELARATGEAGIRMFETELRSSILSAMNTAVLASLSDSNTVTVAGTGDPVADLRTALQAAPASAGYVVAASPGTVAALAVSDANKAGLGIGGGELVPGLSIVPVEGVLGMTVIPAGRLALRDYGLILRSSGQAAIDFRDSPTAPAQLLSLFQANLLGILAERSFLLTAAPDAHLVIVEAS